LPLSTTQLPSSPPNLLSLSLTPILFLALDIRFKS
jgi:hypothetical protein